MRVVRKPARQAGGGQVSQDTYFGTALNEGDNAKGREFGVHYSVLLEAPCFLRASAPPPAESSASAKGGFSPPPIEQFALTTAP
ncbi:hypothetical protein K523DRAFT_142566 [Schizophyllum commune Tattone D]|nr:hypothetical protein K523DRAFT_142566 [Schizophyllum commune Tattone D]